MVTMWTRNVATYLSIAVPVITEDSVHTYIYTQEFDREAIYAANFKFTKDDISPK